MRGSLVWALLACAVAGCAHAPSHDPERWERALLWRIEPPASGIKPSYLLGTMHAPDNRVVLFPDALTRALGGVAIVQTELDMSAAKLRFAQITERLYLPNGRTLESVLSHVAAADLRQLTESAGADWPTVRRMAPWAIMMMDPITAARAAKSGKRAIVLDTYLFEMAKNLHIEVGGIETIDEQLDAMANVPMVDQVKMLEERIAVMSGKEKAVQTVEDIKTAFFLGDGDTIMRNPAWQGSYGKSVIVDRNAKMVERMLERLKQGRPVMFAVGVAHLLGKRGLLSRLQKAGYKVTRVD